jgi:hypothetical protein
MSDLALIDTKLMSLRHIERDLNHCLSCITHYWSISHAGKASAESSAENIEQLNREATQHFHHLRIRSALHCKRLAHKELCNLVDKCGTAETFREHAEGDRQSYIDRLSNRQDVKRELAEALKKSWDELDARSRLHGLSERKYTHTTHVERRIKSRWHSPKVPITETGEVDWVKWEDVCLRKRIAECANERHLLYRHYDCATAAEVENKVRKYERLLEGARRFGLEKEAEKIALLKAAEEIVLLVAKKEERTLGYVLQEKVRPWLRKKVLEML